MPRKRLGVFTLLEIERSVVALHLTVEARTCRSDLIEAIVASCFIPLYLAPAFTTTFRDEVFTLFQI